MVARQQKQKRFLRQPLPVQLGTIAADLARVTSLARHEQISAALDTMLEESLYFIEWTAAKAEPEIAAELVDIQLMIALWRKAWPEAQKHRAQRTLLSVQAKKWSDQILGYSGLLDEK
ncbi:MAG TPA: hypothetical protein PKE45_14650 [Caldilineaceae bacterium]|nr:hypothetical protein [Caldilineaceae bacterium]